ncbi:MAG: Hsp20/alpha crystallin family protein [Cyanobacteria bacterium]|nr:Hsp20/alpha crystallin family protein [Cyanobacteriota bacterium]
MALVQWYPHRELDSLRRQVDRLLDTPLFDGVWDQERLAIVPPAELEETPEALVLRIELPGFEKQDLSIEVTPQAVSISGDRKAPQRVSDNGIYRSEFRYGTFQRTIPLPKRVKNSEAAATYEQGILSLTLPKVDEERNTVVKVNLGS